MSLLDTASLVVTPNAYKEGKLYSVIPSDGSGDLSVTRATTATRVNSAGLVELVPYNLLQYSEQFDNAAWTKAGTNPPVVTANQGTAPNGTLTADRLLMPSTASTSIAFQNIAHTLGTTYTISAYVKSNVSGSQTFRIYGDASIAISSTLTATSEWQRFSFTYTATATGSRSAGFYYIPNTQSDLLVWGAQLVEGTQAKDYFATETRLNISRLDYSLGGCPSILVEPQRTNTLTWSEAFDNAAWTKTNASIIANSVASPSGDVNADTFTDNSTSGIHSIVRFGQWSTTQKTFTIYVKPDTLTKFYIANGSLGSAVFFDLTTATIEGSITGFASPMINSTITQMANGWFRLSTTHTGTAGQTLQIGFYKVFNPTSLALSSVYIGTGESAYIWGAQMEDGAYATSYIGPTTSASVTRNNEIYNKTSISSLIGQTEGTIFVDFDNLLQTTYGSEYLISLYGDASNQIWIRKESGTNTYTARVLASGSTAVTFLNIPVLNGQNKIALAYKSGQSVVYLNGALIATDTDAFTIGTSISQLGLANLNNTLVGYEKINSAALWKERFTNEQLAQLTTI